VIAGSANYAEGENFMGLIILIGSSRKLEEIIKDQQDDFLKNFNVVVQWLVNKQVKKLS